MCFLQEINFSFKDTHRFKVKEQQKIVHENENQKRPRIAIIISNKIDFISKTVGRDKEDQYITIKSSIHQEDITTEIYILLTLEHLNILTKC